MRPAEPPQETAAGLTTPIGLDAHDLASSVRCSADMLCARRRGHPGECFGEVVSPAMRATKESYDATIRAEATRVEHARIVGRLRYLVGTAGAGWQLACDLIEREGPGGIRSPRGAAGAQSAGRGGDAEGMVSTEDDADDGPDCMGGVHVGNCRHARKP